MALAFSTLASINTSTDAADATTASVTPAAGAVVLLVVLNAKGTLPDVPVPGNAWGITAWNSIKSGAFNSSQRRISMFWGYAASYSAGTCQITFGGNTQIGIAASFVNVTGANTGAPSVQNDADTGTGTALAALTLAAFADAVNNAAFVGIAHNAAETPTVTGYTQMHNLSAPGSPAVNLWTGYVAGEDTSIAASWATSSAFRAIGIEVAMAGAASTADLFGSLVTHDTLFGGSLVP